jgi:hypothetical protein
VRPLFRLSEAGLIASGAALYYNYVRVTLRDRACERRCPLDAYENPDLQR